MKLIICVLVAVAAIATPAQAARLPDLSSQTARRLMSNALHQNFAPLWPRQRKELRCTHRIARTKVKCQRIELGNDWITWSGQGRIWLSVHGDSWNWNYAYRIKYVDHWCLTHYPGPECTGTVRVR